MTKITKGRIIRAWDRGAIGGFFLLLGWVLWSFTFDVITHWSGKI